MSDWHRRSVSARHDELVIVGAGEQAAIAHDYFTHDSCKTVVGFAVEGAYLDRHEHRGLPLVALEEMERSFPPGRVTAFVAVSYAKLNRVRARLYAAVKERGYSCATYVSSHAFVWQGAEIGENCMIFENTVVHHGARIGENVLLWTGSQIAHQTQVHDHCFVAAQVAISGYCTVGASSFLGVNSSIADAVAIGKDCVVGAGAVVLGDLPAGGIYVGNPARPLERSSYECFGLCGEGTR